VKTGTALPGMTTENVTATGKEMATANAIIEETMNDATENAIPAAEMKTSVVDGMVPAMTMTVVTAEREKAVAGGMIEENAAVIEDGDVKAKKDAHLHLKIAPRSLNVSGKRRDGTSMHLGMNNTPQCRQNKLVCNYRFLHR
jgi:hypothetical protein